MQKITYKIFCLLTIAAITATSCSKFVDKKPFNQIDESTAVTSLSSAKYAIAGVYDGLQQSTAYSRNYPVFGDAPTDNVLLAASNSGRYLAQIQWTIANNNADVADVWNRSYSIINRANKLLEGLENMTGDVTTKNQYIGECLAIRALLHFDMVRYFSQPYDFTTDASHLGIPYMDHTTVRETPGRDAVSVVYTKVIKDLKDAIGLLQVAPAGRLAPFTITKNAAKALLARVYLYKGDFTNAKATAIDVITNGGYTLLSNANYAASWSLDKTSESIFTLSNVASDYAATDALGYMYLQTGYGDLRVPAPFKALFTATDVRQNFFKAGTGAQTAYTFVNKYPNRDNTSGLSNTQIIRFSEIYLIAAEACAKTNDEPNAIVYLDAIRKRADPTVASTTATGQALINSILLEKRKELCYEGHYFQDLKRLHLSITSGLKDNGTPYTTINYPDNRLAYPIPQRELDANPVIKQQQNPGY